MHRDRKRQKLSSGREGTKESDIIIFQVNFFDDFLPNKGRHLREHAIVTNYNIFGSKRLC